MLLWKSASYVGSIQQGFGKEPVSIKPILPHTHTHTHSLSPSLLAAVHTLIIISVLHTPFTSDPCCHDAQLNTPGVTCTVMSCLCGLASLWWVYLCVCVCADNTPDPDCLCVIKVVLIFDCQLKYCDLPRKSPTPNLSITIRTAPHSPYASKASIRTTKWPHMDIFMLLAHSD